MPVTRSDGALVAMSWVAAQATACAPIPAGPRWKRAHYTEAAGASPSI